MNSKKTYNEFIEEAVSPDILPKSGAGAWGTDELDNTYRKDTPGQSPKKVKTFREYSKK